MVRARRRGTAIVDTPKGILVVSKDGRTYLLPGGGARRNESGQDAAIRELREETGLEAVDIAYLFAFTGVTHTGTRGGLFKNAHKVFLVTATGVPEPRQEIRRVAYYNGSGLKLAYSAQTIIARYLSSLSTVHSGSMRAAVVGDVVTPSPRAPAPRESAGVASARGSAASRPPPRIRPSR